MTVQRCLPLLLVTLLIVEVQMWSLSAPPLSSEQSFKKTTTSLQADKKSGRRPHLPSPSSDRRQFLARSSFFFSIATSIAYASMSTPRSATAAATPAFDKLSVSDAKERFLEARQDGQYLLDHYDEISKKGGGDAVRNYLGTQGVTSNMYGIQKVVKSLQNEADDVVEYTEAMEDFSAYYYQAEGAAYQSMFAGGSSSKSTPESLLATAKVDLLQMMKYMNLLADHLNLEK